MRNLMKMALCGVIGLAVLGDAPASAQAGGQAVTWSGYGEATIGYLTATRVRGESDKQNNDPIVGGAARMAVPIMGGFSAQVDFSGEYTDVEHNYRGSWGGALHLNWRDPSSVLIGLFGGLQRSNTLADIFAGGVGDTYGERAWSRYIGVEGQYYFANATLYGQAGLFDSSTSKNLSDAVRDAWFLRAVGRYFVDPNLMAQVELGFLRGKIDADRDTGKFLTWGARLEKRFEASPVSLFADYTGGRYHQGNEDETMYDHVFRVGVKFSVGHGTLLANDRRGANLDTMPHFGRIVGYSMEPLE